MPEWPEPTEWYRTKEGETALAVGCIPVVAVSWWVAIGLDGLAAELAVVPGLVALTACMILSGRAAEKTVAEVLD